MRDLSDLRAVARRGGSRALRPITTVGRLVAGLGVAAWLGGWLLGWDELMVGAAACAFVLVFACAFTFGRAVLRVDVDVVPTRVVAGEHSSAHAQVVVTNVGAHRLLPIQVDLPVGRSGAIFDIPSLVPGASHDELVVIPTARRSVVTVGPASSVRGDPLGLIRKAVQWHEPITLYVHPKTSPLDRLGSGLLRDLEGQTTNDLSTSDVAFHTLREYVPGDDRRYVHWRSSAKLGTLMVKQFVDTRRSHLAIIQSGDPADYEDDDEYELAVSIAASLGVRAIQDEHTVSMVASGQLVNCATGQRMLDGLAGVELGTPHSDLGSEARQARRSIGDANVLALVTGSRASLAETRIAAHRVSPALRAMAFRAHRGGRTGFRPVGNLTVLMVSELDDLPKLLWAVSLA